jgi:hypothetical protein
MVSLVANRRRILDSGDKRLRLSINAPRLEILTNSTFGPPTRLMLFKAGIEEALNRVDLQQSSMLWCVKGCFLNDAMLPMTHLLSCKTCYAFRSKGRCVEQPFERKTTTQGEITMLSVEKPFGTNGTLIVCRHSEQNAHQAMVKFAAKNGQHFWTTRRLMGEGISIYYRDFRKKQANL